MSSSEQINTAAVSRSKEESKPLQSTKDLKIKEKQREFYKNKKEKAGGHHFKNVE